jgi:hypothetical protein
MSFGADLKVVSFDNFLNRCIDASGTITLSDLRQALAEISAIRTQVARDTQFRGYGPLSIASSGVLAIMVAALQAHFWKNNTDFGSFLFVWACTAAVTIMMAVSEMVSRARRAHSDLANEMIYTAVEQFLPVMIASILLTVVLTRTATREEWMLPGLWQLMFSIGVFGSCRFLPRQMGVVGVWYLVCGLTCLVVESGLRTFSPWTMGIPFGIGQLLVAAVLHFCLERPLDDA